MSGHCSAGEAFVANERRGRPHRPSWPPWWFVAALLASSAVALACGGKASSDAGASGNTGNTSGDDEDDEDDEGEDTTDPSELTFSRIVAGRDHFCGITQSDQRLVCVADDEIVHDESGPFVALDMNNDVPGWDYRCAVKENGELACSGAGDLPAPSGEFVEVSVGFFNACALRTTGELECWVPESIGGSPSVESAAPGFSVDQWSFCSKRGPLEASCIGFDGTELLPTDGSGHFLGGYFVSVKAAPLAGCAAIAVSVPDQEYEDFGEILNKDNIACFSASGGRSKLDGLFSAFDVNVNEDGCAIHPDQGSIAPVACWGAFEGSVPSGLTGPFTQVSVSAGLACVLHATGTVSCWPART